MTEKTAMKANAGLRTGVRAGISACASELGPKPSVFAKGGAGEAVEYAAGECSLGAILVAATAQGICAIELGDERGPLLERLKRHVTGGHLVWSRSFTTTEGHRPSIVHKRSLDILHDPWFNKVYSSSFSSSSLSLIPIYYLFYLFIYIYIFFGFVVPIYGFKNY